MDNTEFSTEFDILYNNISSNQAPELNEYEKSVFLTRAQEDIVYSYYNGKNPSGESFESTEEIRRYLDSLIKTKVYTANDRITDRRINKVAPVSIFFALPNDLAFITLEQVQFKDDSLGCAKTSVASVQPVTQDLFNKIKDNPFRGPTRYRVLRLDADDAIELVSKYNIDRYTIRYMSKPTPIVLTTLPEGLSINGVSNETQCTLNSMLHNSILRRAVTLATQAAGVVRDQ